MAVRLLKSTNWSNDCSKSRKTHILKQNILFQVKHVVLCFYLSFCWFCLTCLPETIFSVSFFVAFTYLFVHRVTDTLTHSFIESLFTSDWFIGSMSRWWVIGSLDHWLINDSLVHRSIIGSLVHWFADSLIDLLIHSFIGSLHCYYNYYKHYVFEVFAPAMAGHYLVCIFIHM